MESTGESAQLKQAIDTNNLDGVIALMTRDPALHTAPLGYARRSGVNAGQWRIGLDCRVAPAQDEPCSTHRS